MTKDRLLLLLTAYLEDNLLPEDYRVLVDYLHEKGHEQVLDEAIVSIMDELDLTTDMPIPSDEIYQGIIQDSRFKESAHLSFQRKRHPKKRPWLLVATAAIGLILVLFGGWFLSYVNNGSTNWQTSSVASSNITPGGKKAILTLADGTCIALDSTANKEVAVQGNMHIRATRGRLIYASDVKKSKESNQELLNTIATPTGGEYQVVLPDGTKVWLNSASSISYPLVFSENERRLSMKGEVYFEVAADKSNPFVVDVAGVQIDVLGTHFNVCAYADDKLIKTTLVQGSVQVRRGEERHLLKPGQQAQTSLTAEKTEIVSVDLEETLAWKNGNFFFNSEPLERVMKKISRWYDVEIEYKGNFEGKRLDGTISKAEDIRQLLAGFEKTKIARFTIKGRRVIVMN
ncbi:MULTISPECIES: FecR family protein [Olivibacter]|jgi:ferric-dicitrate binding protein FerR (iron transport regulator)|uniref:FecR domain-containing protein n=1 Tax=Olivibacter oleidegradans TaxID=760123 RepID=A0ABV6HGM7_9SPHI|nr:MULTISPECIES: FecR family protein [Olivibacter]MDM8176683.1 FecR domain-containing protein [Olivibacter sp. 47]QEL00508.1 DUF4974 domain-containing protein [Olivibacter sp. LS-1]